MGRTRRFSADVTPVESLSSSRLQIDPNEASLARLVRFNQVWFALCLQMSLGRHGLAAGMWHFVMALAEGDGITLRELSRRAGTMEPTTNAQIGRMEQLGLVRRVEDKVDRRKVRIYLTRKGKSLRTKLIPLAAEINDAAVDGFTKSEIKTMRTMLARMLVNLSGMHNKLAAEVKNTRADADTVLD